MQRLTDNQPSFSGGIEHRLEQLAARAAWEMGCIEAEAPIWLKKPQRDAHYNVAIVGGGLNGLSAAFALRRRGIEGVLVIDQAEAGREGPWITSARMKTLRSPKTLAGPDFGIPSLSPRAWYETVYGAEAFAGLEKIDREDWMRYMLWFRKASGITVHNRTRLEAVAEAEGGVRLTISGNEALPGEITCRRLIMANGMDGCGGPYVPDDVAALPKGFWTHSAEETDDSHLKGKDVIVLGSATSSFDWAVTALEAGARRVTMVARAKELACTEVLAWTNFPGYLGSYAELPDAEKWRFSQHYYDLKVPPTQDQYDRATSYANFVMELGSGVTSLVIERGRIRAETKNGTIEADHILLGTGYGVDFSMRPELAALEGRFAHWRDRFTPPEGETCPPVLQAPYLGRTFELTPMDAERDRWVSRIHMFNGGAVPSLGPISNGITGVKYGIARIADGMTRAFFLEDAAHFREELAHYREQHFNPRDRISA
ncbi:NAD(P)-binding domain-containing protein [Martelella mediterranea]|uniref:Glutamate synthase subunit beta n=1 Tax=Martelella mediterranea DSM 17316 TaxID=1122214 RepID=A0A1U9Z389_9HYPH|nr:NAD(P)/FAD-dependent oxidoreductase [Martelella mediterranea]AQZ52163.1 glutamate synthase subunit beta [Martelella mediterranea DSM 17316]